MYVHVKSDSDETRFIATWPEAGYFAPSKVNGWAELTNWLDKQTYVSDAKIYNLASDYIIFEDIDYYYFYDSSDPIIYKVAKTTPVTELTSFDDYGVAGKIYYWPETNTYWHYVWNYEQEVALNIPSSYDYCWKKVTKIIVKDTLPSVGIESALYHITSTDTYHYWNAADKCWQGIGTFTTINETEWSDYEATNDFNDCVTVKCIRDTDNKEYPLMYIPTKGYQLGWIQIYNWDSPKTIRYEYEVFRECNQHLVYKSLIDSKIYLYAAHKPGYQKVTACKISELPADPLEDTVYHRLSDDTYWYYCYNYSSIKPNNNTTAIWRKPLYCQYIDSLDELPLDGDLDMIACIVEDAATPGTPSYYLYNINTDGWEKFEFEDAEVSMITDGSPSNFNTIYNAAGTYQGNQWHTYWVGTDVSQLQPSGDWVQITNFTNPQSDVDLDAFTNAGNNKLVAVIKTAPAQKYLYKEYMPGTVAITSVQDVNYALPPDYGNPTVVYHRKADNTYWHFELHWKTELYPPALTGQSWNKIYNIKYITSQIAAPQEYNLYSLDDKIYWIDPALGEWNNMSDTGRTVDGLEDNWGAYIDNLKLYAIHATRGGFDFITYWTIKTGTKDTSNWVYITNYNNPEQVENLLAVYDKANNHLIYQVGAGPETGWIQIENYNDPIYESMDTIGWVSNIPQNTLYMHTDNMRYGNQGEYPGVYAELAPAMGNVRDCETLPVGNIYQGIYHRTTDDTYWTYCYDFSRSESYVPDPPTGYKWVHPTAMYYNSGGNFPIQGVEGVVYKSKNRRSVWYNDSYHHVSIAGTHFKSSQWATYNVAENAGKAYEVWIDRPNDCEVASNYAVIWYLQPII